MGGKVVAVLLCVFILGLVIYAVNTNVLGKMEAPLGSMFHSSSSIFSFHGSLSTSLLPLVTSTSGGASPAAAPVPENAASPAAPTINPADIPAGFTASQLSPYFKKITFGSVSAASNYSYGQVTLLTHNLAASDTVDITGWQIKTNRGGEYIPQAINVYDPSGLAAQGDIVVDSGQYVYVYSSPGPFNLRLNKCIGYIANSIKFTPSLPSDCPSVDQSAISKMGFTGACESYIYSIGSCQAPNLNSINVPQNDYACRDYLSNNFNYRSCFNAHVGDADFLSDEWWIWMGSSPLDQYHDTVNLLDRNGLLVDQDSY